MARTHQLPDAETLFLMLMEEKELNRSDYNVNLHRPLCVELAGQALTIPDIVNYIQAAIFHYAAAYHVSRPDLATDLMPLFIRALLPSKRMRAAARLYWRRTRN